VLPCRAARPHSPECVEGLFSEVGAENLHPAGPDGPGNDRAGKRKAGPRSWEGDLTAGFSGHDPHRMMRMYGLQEKTV